jgi:MFS family permease
VIDDAKDRGTESTPSDEPSLVRFTSLITDTPDPDQAGRMADMLLLFLAAGGTVLGTILGAVLFLYFTMPHAPTFGWICALLVSVGLSGLGGCAVVMMVLHTKGMIAWEHRREH